ncbi:MULTISPECIES: aspartate/glutamate racemase family protein [unclassified Paraburkholderia]|uniref:aspartate/glutamate racemase family protein n=1 Tax=unclassified Paraburkholderia TaxID=2615204 RepID=UPI002AB3265D|nr:MULTISPECIES: aspartate/glutamate racemase family protein [unclassified Paraburkholderia]
MRKIGLIGGMSCEATAVYYRQINQLVKNRLGGLHQAELLLYSVDFQKIVEMQQAGRWDEAGEYLASIGRTLERAGADCLLICAVTMHLVAPPVESAVSIPLIHVIDETAKHLQAANCKRPFLIATRYTMEHGYYHERMKRHGIDVIVPDADGRTQVHKIIFNELCAGSVQDSSRQTLNELINKAKAEGADSVIFGCTEICLILDADKLELPGFDSTAIHAEAATMFALA